MKVYFTVNNEQERLCTVDDLQSNIGDANIIKKEQAVSCYKSVKRDKLFNFTKNISTFQLPSKRPKLRYIWLLFKIKNYLSFTFKPGQSF